MQPAQAFFGHLVEQAVVLQAGFPACPADQADSLHEGRPLRKGLTEFHGGSYVTNVGHLLSPNWPNFFSLQGFYRRNSQRKVFFPGQCENVKYNLTPLLFLWCPIPEEEAHHSGLSS